jgi:hypothetical protein
MKDLVHLEDYAKYFYKYSPILLIRRIKVFPKGRFAYLLRNNLKSFFLCYNIRFPVNFFQINLRIKVITSNFLRLIFFHGLLFQLA